MNKTIPNLPTPPVFASPPVTPLILRANKRLVTESERTAMAAPTASTLPQEPPSPTTVPDPLAAKETA